jgi:tetratricopeptide (TPR) repeat protein
MMLNFDDDFDDLEDFEDFDDDDFEGLGGDFGGDFDGVAGGEFPFAGGRIYPDFVYEWDEALVANRQPPRFFDSEEMCNMIAFYSNGGEEDKLKKTIAAARKVFPEDDEVLGDAMDALENCGLWNDLLLLSEPHTCQGNFYADSHFLYSLLHLGMEEEAFMAFTKMLAVYAEDEHLSAVYLAMGDALADVDLFRSSIEVVDEGIRLFPDSMDFYWINIESLWAIDEKEKALATADALAQMNAMDAKFWSQLGDLYNTMGEFDRAVEAFHFSESLGYDRNLNLLDLAKTYYESENYAKALESLETFANEQGDSAPQQILANTFIPLVAAEVCAKLGEWEKAIVHLDKSIAFSPNSELFYHSKAEALVHLNRNDEAISILEEGIRMCRDEDNFLKNLLRKFKAGDFDMGREGFLDD